MKERATPMFKYTLSRFKKPMWRWPKLMRPKRKVKSPWRSKTTLRTNKLLIIIQERIIKITKIKMRSLRIKTIKSKKMSLNPLLL